VQHLHLHQINPWILIPTPQLVPLVSHTKKNYYYKGIQFIGKLGHDLISSQEQQYESWDFRCKEFEEDDFDDNLEISNEHYDCNPSLVSTSKHLISSRCLVIWDGGQNIREIEMFTRDGSCSTTIWSFGTTEKKMLDVIWHKDLCARANICYFCDFRGV